MTVQARASTSITDLSFEYHGPGNALGVGEGHPRISWKITDTQVDFVQEYYEIELYKTETYGMSAARTPFESVKVNSNQSSLVLWPSKIPLQSRERIYVQVRSWAKGVCSPSAWSDMAFVEAGLLHRSDWCCERVIAPWEQDPDIPKPEQLYRKEFSLRLGSEVAWARLYITAQGVYEAEIDGVKVGDAFLTPGWQSYHHRLHYQTYDVSKQFQGQTTDHCIGVRVGEGWFSGRIGFGGGQRNIWGSQTALIAQLEINYSDGTTETLVSDNSWVVAPGPIQKAEIYDGEKYDGHKEVPGWSNFQGQGSEPNNIWVPVRALELPSTSTDLVAMIGQPVREIEKINPIRKFTTPSGKTVLDFGQNLVGFVRIKNVRGLEGHFVSLFHAEVLEKGECARRPLRDCDALDQFVLHDRFEDESWSPRFTFHGFRYLQVDNWPSAAANLLDCLEAVVCHTDMQSLGAFTCSNKLVTKLHENIRWSMRGNFFDVPTDCPQRDERLGWTGDVAVFAATACFLYDCTGMLISWLADVAAEQFERGGIPPLVSPNVISGTNEWAGDFPCAIWNDVTIMAPWALFESTGDLSILVRQWASMQAWMRVLPRGGGNSGRLWAPTSCQLGDWLDPTAPPDAPAKGQTDAQLVANAFLARCLAIMTEIAAAIGEREDMAFYGTDHAQVCKDFADEYITPNGRLTSDSQTAYALAISFDLLPKIGQRQRAGDRLAELVRANNFRIGTGFAGTPFVCEALTRCGHAQIAYRMLLEQECPSWLYPVTMGATTVWERWDSMLPDGSINPGEMTSFNHYALGAVATFLHERLGGLTRLEPGWKRFRAAPIIGGEFTSASVSHITPYGEAACSWEILEASTGKEEAQIFKMRVLVPPNTVAEVIIPSANLEESGKRMHEVGAGEWFYSVPYIKSFQWPPTAITWAPGSAQTA